MSRNTRSEIDELRKRRKRIDADWSGGGRSPLLNFYVKVMTRMLGAERCGIFIVDPSTGKLWLKCGTDVAERGIEVEMGGDSVVGRVVTSGKPVILHGLETRPGAHKTADSVTGFVTRSILCVPIRTLDGQRTSGAVELLNKTGGSEFTEEDRATLEETAHFLQHSIENIYYSQDVLDALGRVSRFAAAAVTVAVISVLGLMSLLIVYWVASSLWRA
ncbi:MAG: GAF domain-containing protein [Gammaproteobacteria bacterium]